MEQIINNIIEKQPGVTKPQKKFLVTLFLTMLLMRGKVNFRNLSRYSELNEKTYTAITKPAFKLNFFLGMPNNLLALMIAKPVVKKALIFTSMPL